MGIKLVVEVLDHCPPEASPAERLVLLALAEKARDETRVVLPSRLDGPCTRCGLPEAGCAGRDGRGRAGTCCQECRHRETVRETLLRRTGLSPEGLTKVLRRLAARTPSLEVRVPLRHDARGRPVFAWEGVDGRFRLHELIAEGAREGTLSNLHRVDDEAPSAQEGGPQDTLGWTRGHPLDAERVDERAGHIPQSLKNPSYAEGAREGTLSPAEAAPPEHREAILELMARLGADVNEADIVDCVAWVARAKKPKTTLARYVSRFPAEDVRKSAADWRAKGSDSGPTGSPSAILCNTCDQLPEVCEARQRRWALEDRHDYAPKRPPVARVDQPHGGQQQERAS